MNGDDERCCHSRFPQAGGKPRYPKLRFVYRVSPDPDASEKHAFFSCRSREGTVTFYIKHKRYVFRFMT